LKSNLNSRYIPILLSLIDFVEPFGVPLINKRIREVLNRVRYTIKGAFENKGFPQVQWLLVDNTLTDKEYTSPEKSRRDLILVENGYYREAPPQSSPKGREQRAVRYAIFRGISRPYGTYRASGVSFFYQHFVPNGTFVSPLFKFLSMFLKNNYQIFVKNIQSFFNQTLILGSPLNSKVVPFSFLPNLINKTTSVADRLPHLINLITSFFANGFLKLGKTSAYPRVFSASLCVINDAELRREVAENRRDKALFHKKIK